MPEHTGIAEIAGLTEADLDRIYDEMAAKIAERLGASDDRPLYSVASLATRLDLSQRTVRDMLARGVIPSIKVADGARRVEPAAVDAYLERQRNGG